MTKKFNCKVKIRQIFNINPRTGKYRNCDSIYPFETNCITIFMHLQTFTKSSIATTL